MGKTFLLQHFFAERTEASPYCYYLADQSTAENQRLMLAERLLETFPTPGLAPYEIAATWNSLLRYFSGKVNGERAALILDEFPYLVAQSPELPSVLQAWWDLEAIHTSAFVVLCGSQLSVMAALADETAPLHGRFNAGRLRLEPMAYVDVGAFYESAPAYGPLTKLLMYGAFGGTPRYHSLADTELAWDEQIVDLLFRPGAPFEGEGRSLLASEQVRDLAPFNAILGAIARGATRHGEIQTASGLLGTAVSYPLNVLQELEWIRKERSFGETSDRRATYRIADPFLQFWYRFGAPFASAFRFEDPMAVFNARVRPRLDEYMGRYVFEEVGDQWLRANTREEFGASIDRIGRYWSRDGRTEIDVVAELADGRYLFAECKWSAQSQVGSGVYASLRAKVESLPEASWRRHPVFVLFSVGGFTDELRVLAESEGNVLLVDGERLYATG